MDNDCRTTIFSEVGINEKPSEDLFIDNQLLSDAESAEDEVGDGLEVDGEGGAE